MEVKMTKRADGSFRASDYSPKHFATGMYYGEDEIILEKIFDIPDAYKTESGEIAWDNGNIKHHPAIASWIAQNR